MISSKLSRPIRWVVTPILLDTFSISATLGFLRSRPISNTFLFTNERIDARFNAQNDLPSPETVDVNAITPVPCMFFMKNGRLERIARNDSAIEDFGFVFTGIVSECLLCKIEPIIGTFVLDSISCLFLIVLSNAFNNNIIPHGIPIPSSNAINNKNLSLGNDCCALTGRALSRIFMSEIFAAFVKPISALFCSKKL